MRNCDHVIYAGRIISIVLAFVIIVFAVPVAASVPGAPIIGTASGERDGRATVTFTASVSDGGSPILDYFVTASTDNLTATGSSSPITISGLTNGTAYTFTVTARNSDGSGPPSGASNNVRARPYAPTTGTISNLVVFIRFSDQPEFTQPLSYYEGLFNSDAKSLRNFYLENSYNALTVDSYFYPASSGPLISYQDSHPTSYYSPYDAITNPIGYQGAEGAVRETTLVSNALNAVSSQIPDGLNLDGDSDGYIDHITFEVYSTDVNPLPVLFYSRATYDTSGAIVIKGKHVGSYTWITAPQDSPEFYLASTEIHEMGHSFGYPDLRDNSGRTPVGDWDVMSLSRPVHSGVYMKYRFTKWISEIPDITSYGVYTINDITQPTNNSFKIKLPNTKNEFLILEYRKASGPFESNLPGSGLCITRVNEADGIWGNLNGPPYYLYYYRTDGTISSDGVGADFLCFNAESGRTQFNDYSNPACFLSDGSSCGISIYNIGAASGPTISFSVGDPNSTVVTHVISGYLFNGGNRVNGATVTLSGDDIGTVTTVNLGKYLFTVNAGGNYTITPSMENLTFSPISATFNNLTNDQTRNFSATNNKNTISGTITSGGTPLSGVAVNCYGGNYPPPVTTDATGTYSFSVDAGSDYDVRPSKANYFFSPNGKTFTNVTTDQVQNFSTWTATVNLTGMVILNGFPLSGVSVSCPGANTPAQATTDGSGNYSFNVTVGNGSVYTVTPSSSAYSFLPASKFYTGLISNQTQNFAATALPASTTALVSSVNPSMLGQNVIFTATVSGNGSTGTVTFDDGGSAICAAVPLSNDQAQCSANSLAAGSHSITAVYSGDGNNAGSASASLTQDVVASDFFGTPVYGSAPVAVNFYDQSISPSAWLWDFGDGATSTEQNPVHLYKSSGVFTVSLTAMVAAGSVKTMKNNYISADALCVINPIKIADTGSYPASIQSAFHDLGDGGTLQIQGIDFTEDLNPPQDISFELSGGYSCDYSSNPGFTTVKGTLTISHSKVTIENIVIQ